MRKYSFDLTSVLTSPVELLMFQCAGNVRTVLKRVLLSDVDLVLPTAQMLALDVITFASGATPGSGGTEVSSQQVDYSDGDIIIGGSPATGNTIMSTGTIQYVGTFGVHVWAGPLEVDFGEDGLYVPANGILSVRIISTASGTVTVALHVDIEQEGA